jgi:[FeFe] hydrogenase H-cluster maturation GTPase HydF
MIAGQEVAITSPVPGTTTDVVEKAMELLPLGPVLFLDTAGLDDVSELATARTKKTRKIFDVSDIILLTVEPDTWTGFEDAIVAEAKRQTIPFIVIVNKTDRQHPSGSFLQMLEEKAGRYLLVSASCPENRDSYVNALKKQLIEIVPDEFMNPRSLVADLLPANGIAVLIVPIDSEAPKGRLILPQVQTIRDALDNSAAALVVKEREYAQALTLLSRQPDIVICDSQVVLKMMDETPENVPCTTFSILFARNRGDLAEAAAGAAAIKKLKPGDKVLIAEACSHHALEDDIGRVKIPRWLKQYTGFDVTVDVTAGADYPDNLAEYALVIHCGGCMINRRHMLSRIQKAKEAGVPVTNYGVAISFLQGVLERALSPFPDALDAYRQALKS